MKKRMKSTIALCSALTMLSCGVLPAMAENVPAEYADAYTYLASVGMEESALAAAESGDLAVDRFAVAYYRKADAANQEMRVFCRPFHTDSLKPDSIVVSENAKRNFNGYTRQEDGRFFDLVFYAYPSADSEIITVYFEAQDTTASVASILSDPEANYLWVKGEDETFYGQDWKEYVECDVLGLGDVNQDGKLNINDLADAVKIVNGALTFTDERVQKAAADLDGDGQVTQADIDLLSDSLTKQTAIEIPVLANSVILPEYPDDMLGDVNLDGEVDIKDAVLISRIVAEDAEVDPLVPGAQNADINQDGMVTTDDVMVIVQKLCFM